MAYDNSINIGAPPLLWSEMYEAFQQINENFTIIGSSLGRSVAYDIAHIELENPVRIVLTSSQSGIITGQQVFLDNTGVSQLDGNTYYGRRVSDDEVELFTDATLTSTVDGAGYDSYASGGGTIQGLTDFAAIDFINFESDIIPSENTEFDLGSQTRRWAELHLGEVVNDVESSEYNGLYLGSAQVKGINGTVDLPVNSTVNGQLIIDPDKTFFKEVQVDNDQVIVANSFVDSLNLLSGTAIQLSVDSSSESVTITNTGVTELTGGTGISVDTSTGNVTLTNTGVTSLTNGTSIPDSRSAGSGIVVDSSSGNVLITNTGILEVSSGFGINASTSNGSVQIQVNTAEIPRTSFTQFVIDGDLSVNAIEADGVADVFTFDAGYGIQLSSNASTDTLSIAVDQNIDINGSVFSQSSTLLVDALNGVIPAENLSGTITLDTIGFHTGDVKGSVFADDSSLIVDAVDNRVYADRIVTPQIVATTSFGLSTGGLTTISTTDNIELNATSGAIYASTTLFDITGPLTVSGNITGNLTGDVKGSVFADNSVRLIDGVDGIIHAEYLQGTAQIDIKGSVFGDDSTVIIDGATSTVTGKIAPNGTTPGSEFAAGESGEIRVDDNYIWVKTPTTGAWKKVALTSFGA